MYAVIGEITRAACAVKESAEVFFFLKSKNGPFLTIFGLILAMFLTSQPYDFDAIAHIGL